MNIKSEWYWITNPCCPRGVASGRGTPHFVDSQPALLQERLELPGMRPPKPHQPGEHPQRLGPQMMLDHFDFLLDCPRAQAEELK